MYGTVAYLQTQPGAEANLLEQFRAKLPGLVTSYLFRMDAASNTYYAVVMFENKTAYVANANSPEQHTRYEAMRKLLTAEPEWHDGEVIHNMAYGL
ncbi:MAG: hypothetical protein H0X30_39780 [Anaerolineae bacterium]|nr:hypothetical protein [Anaerolineae bacterium]